MLPGVIGLVQATEAVKVLLGLGEPLIGRLLTYDALGMRFREVKLRRDPQCPLCGANPTITDLSVHAQGGAACAVSPAGGAPTAGAAGEPTAGGGSRQSAAADPRPAPSGGREPASLATGAACVAEGVTTHTGC